MAAHRTIRRLPKIMRSSRAMARRANRSLSGIRHGRRGGPLPCVEDPKGFAAPSAGESRICAAREKPAAPEIVMAESEGWRHTARFDVCQRSCAPLERWLDGRIARFRASATGDATPFMPHADTPKGLAAGQVHARVRAARRRGKSPRRRGRSGEGWRRTAKRYPFLSIDGSLGESPLATALALHRSLLDICRRYAKILTTLCSEDPKGSIAGQAHGTAYPGGDARQPTANPCDNAYRPWDSRTLRTTGFHIADSRPSPERRAVIHNIRWVPRGGLG